jgi:hypothetical protein
VRLPGISKAERKRFRARAEMTEEELGAALRHLQRKALAAIGKAGAKSEPPAKEKQGPKATDKSPPKFVAPRQKLSAWTKLPDGTMMRTLTAIDAKANGRQRLET